MTKPTKAKADNNTLNVQQGKDESGGMALARVFLAPDVRHALTASAFVAPLTDKLAEKPGINDYADRIKATGAKAEAGDLTFASRMLAAQATTLDTMFSELARRTAVNMGEYINAADRYARLALKAQSNCRATLESLAKLHQPREQTVKHVHVNEGGQAVVADHFHHNRGVKENDKIDEQPHATGAAGAGPALSGPDPLGNGVPIASRERAETVPDARGS